VGLVIDASIWVHLIAVIRVIHHRVVKLGIPQGEADLDLVIIVVVIFRPDAVLFGTSYVFNPSDQRGRRIPSDSPRAAVPLAIGRDPAIAGSFELLRVSHGVAVGLVHVRRTSGKADNSKVAIFTSLNNSITAGRCRSCSGCASRVGQLTSSCSGTADSPETPTATAVGQRVGGITGVQAVRVSVALTTGHALAISLILILGKSEPQETRKEQKLPHRPRCVSHVFISQMCISI